MVCTEAGHSPQISAPMIWLEEARILSSRFKVFKLKCPCAQLVRNWEEASTSYSMNR